MTLQVTERQSVEQWYELSGAVEAKELFPTLLPNSESLKEVEDIQTEPEVSEGDTDGCPQPDEEMENEIAEFTDSALSEFHDEALTAAKNLLTALKAGKRCCTATSRSKRRKFWRKLPLRLVSPSPGTQWKPRGSPLKRPQARFDSSKNAHWQSRERQKLRRFWKTLGSYSRRAIHTRP